MCVGSIGTVSEKRQDILLYIIHGDSLNIRNIAHVEARHGDKKHLHVEVLKVRTT